MAIHTRSKTVLTILIVLVTGVPGFAAEPTSRLLTGGEYTKRIEGPAVDAAGALYAMNLGSDGVIGKLSPGATTSVPFATLPNGGIGSGARFDRAGRLYVADFKNHKVHVFEPGQTMPGVYFEAREDDPPGKFNQPNDLAMAADGTIYASDPKRSDGTGRIWRITRGADGKVRGELLTFGNQPMGVTNGIELSPDEATLLCRRIPDQLEARTPSGLPLARRQARRAPRAQDVRPVRSRRDADRYRWQTFRGATRCRHGGGIRSRWNSLAGNPLAEKGSDQSGLRRPRWKNRVRHPKRG
jgi:sugar lactone lactonase YvrE